MHQSNHQRTRIKICGLTTVEEAVLVAECGADSIGLVFHQKSPRYIDPQLACEIRQSMPPFVTVTALFLNETEAWVNEVVQRVQPDCLQFHGTEDAAFCQNWGGAYIKAIPMGSAMDANGYASQYESAQGFLMDSNVAGRQGGSGDTFDWSKIPADFRYPLILAGGLSPQNVAQAIAQTQPWAVDVSSGVESSQRMDGGLKDAALIRQFCHEVNRADCQVIAQSVLTP